MQINSVNSITPQFKALKISSNVKPLLENTSKEYIISLNKLGEKVKDFKHFDVVYKDNLVPKIYAVTSKSEVPYDYYAKLLKEENSFGKYYEVGDDSECSVDCFLDQPYIFITTYGTKEAAKKYNEFKLLTSFDKVAEYCRLLNDREEKRQEEMRAQKAEEIAKLAVERVEKEAFENEVNSLYDDYGYIEPLVQPEEPVKPDSLWAKIKGVFKK